MDHIQYINTAVGQTDPVRLVCSRNTVLRKVKLICDSRCKKHTWQYKTPEHEVLYTSKLVTGKQIQDTRLVNNLRNI